MSRSVMEDAFAHHVWATLRLVDTCLPLSSEQLETRVLGTYGSILAAVRHLVGADSSYLYSITGGRTAVIDEDHMALPELRAAMEGHGPAWSGLLAQDIDPDAIVVRHRDDGSEAHASLRLRLAHAVPHRPGQRLQICAGLPTRD